MVPSIIEHAKELWATWNIRGFIFLSLSVQVLLILFAPLRKSKGGKWGKCLTLLIWSAYLLADWVAGFTIGLIVSKQSKSHTKSSDIHVFWAPFLLLHLGGPDTITSFALEDNEFWVRHLLGLGLQVGSTAYVFFKSLPDNKFWLPTILVSLAGIIKYAERNRAFYLASFGHLGDGWVPSEWGDELKIPAEFRQMDRYQENIDRQSILNLWTAGHHLGTIKMILVGPLFSPNQWSEIRETFLQPGNASQVLRIMEIELSLLYEVLHTKLPVVGCRIGFILRFITLSCMCGAFLSFSLFKKNYDLRHFDIWLTYGLLIGALLLDVISIILLIFSDWILIAHFHRMNPRFIKKRRWSAAVSQLNFLTYYVKDCAGHGLFKEVADIFRVRGLLEAIKKIRYLSSQNFREDQEWPFIFKEVKQLNEFLNSKMAGSSQTFLEPKQVWLYFCEQICGTFGNSERFTKIIEKLDYTKSVLMWHIATELCYENSMSGSTNERDQNHRAFCKLLSDYMFYLSVMQPTMMASVSVNWKMVFEDTLADMELFLRRSSISNEKDASIKILRLNPNIRNPERQNSRSVLSAASVLACQLKQSQSQSQSDDYPWESMCRVWIQLMCFAAINCRPNVHAQQPSKGGELLTFVWLFMNHLGFGTHFSTH